MKGIRALVVDDSVLMRKLISDILNEDPDIEVASTAPNGHLALEKIGQFRPDVVTLDIEMPEMDGIETLTRVMKEDPLPVVMISALTHAGAELTFKALELGAVDFITKPDMAFSAKIREVGDEIRMKVKAAARVRVKQITKAVVEAVEETTRKVKENIVPAVRTGPSVSGSEVKRIVTIGISTGGPEALRQILPSLPAELGTAVTIVQHMPPGFTKAFADRMNALSRVEVLEARDRDAVFHGRILIAPGDFHLIVEARDGKAHCRINQKDRVNLFRPSIDVLMRSTADAFGAGNMGIIMTGMARDGVEGIRYVKERGGRTMAQDEASSVVFGMNKLAIQTGAVDKVVTLDRIVPAILEWIRSGS